MKTGFAKINISPDRDAPLLGYNERQEIYPKGNLGIHDDLYLRATAISNEDLTGLLISIDIATMLNAVARKLRHAIAKASGVPFENIILACSHTHSAPFPVELDESEKNPEDPAQQADNEWITHGVPYCEKLEAAAVTASLAALKLMSPAKLGHIAAPLGLGYVRRIETEEGLRHCWNPQEQPDLPLVPAPDPSCDVLVFRSTNAMEQQLFFSLGVHPTTLGKTSNIVSGEWPGLACEQLNALLPGTHAQFGLGPCGEIHPWFSTQREIKAVEILASTVANFVASLNNAVRFEEAPEFKIQSTTIKIKELELDISVWRLGETRVLAIPCELFQTLGLKIKAQVAGPLMIITEANGRTGYWPDGPDFKHGKYEVDIATGAGLDENDPDLLVEELVKLVNAI